MPDAQHFSAFRITDAIAFRALVLLRRHTSFSPLFSITVGQQQQLLPAITLDGHKALLRMLSYFRAVARVVISS